MSASSAQAALTRLANFEGSVAFCGLGVAVVWALAGFVIWRIRLANAAWGGWPWQPEVARLLDVSSKRGHGSVAVGGPLKNFAVKVRYAAHPAGAEEVHERALNWLGHISTVPREDRSRELRAIVNGIESDKLEIGINRLIARIPLEKMSDAEFEEFARLLITGGVETGGQGPDPDEWPDHPPVRPARPPHSAEPAELDPRKEYPRTG